MDETLTQPETYPNSRSASEKVRCASAVTGTGVMIPSGRPFYASQSQLRKAFVDITIDHLIRLYTLIHYQKVCAGTWITASIHTSQSLAKPCYSLFEHRLQVNVYLPKYCPFLTPD